jgi:transposase
VDVSKARLDASIEPGAIFESFDNDAAGIAELAAFCHQRRAGLVILEASGGYERRAFLLLWEAGMPCAGIIARFAHAKNLQPMPAPMCAQRVGPSLLN